MSEQSSTGPKEPSYHHIVSTYASRFGPNDDQATVTDGQREVRQQTAAEGADQYERLTSPTVAES